MRRSGRASARSSPGSAWRPRESPPPRALRRAAAARRARALLVYNPPVLLLDEPLSNLDAKLREEARGWLRELIEQLDLAASA